MRLAGPLLRSLAVNDRVFAEPAKQSSTKAETRLAILCGEGEQAPAEAALAQLEVTLSREQRLALVERAGIKRILEEQKLSASGLIEGAAGARLDRLLSAEMFLRKKSE